MLLANGKKLQKSAVLDIGARRVVGEPRCLPRAQSRVTTVQSVTYVAGPVTVQLMLTVRPRSPATFAGVNFTSALPLPFALVSIVAVGMTELPPLQSRLGVGKMWSST